MFSSCLVFFLPGAQIWSTWFVSCLFDIHEVLCIPCPRAELMIGCPLLLKSHFVEVLEMSVAWSEWFGAGLETLIRSTKWTFDIFSFLSLLSLVFKLVDMDL